MVTREIPLNVDGFEGRDFKIVDRGIFKPVRIYIDGKRVRMKMFKYWVTDNAGNSVKVKLNPSFVVDMFTSVTIKNTTIPIMTPLPGYQYVLASWPLLMLFIGGAIGGGLGGAATILNITIFRSRLHGLLKYLFVFAISFASVIIWFMLVILIHSKLN